MTSLGQAVANAYQTTTYADDYNMQWDRVVAVNATWLRRICAGAVMSGGDAVEAERIVDAAVASMSDRLLEAGLEGIADGLLAGDGR